MAKKNKTKSKIVRMPSHKHWCGIGCHYFRCTADCVCICGKPMNLPCHKSCPTLLDNCPKHPPRPVVDEGAVCIDWYRGPTPAERKKDKQELAFRRAVLFVHLDRQLLDWDSPVIDYFNAADFLKVIARCELLGIDINGIEVMVPQDHGMVDVKTGPENETGLD